MAQPTIRHHLFALMMFQAPLLVTGVACHDGGDSQVSGDSSTAGDGTPAEDSATDTDTPVPDTTGDSASTPDSTSDTATPGDTATSDVGTDCTTFGCPCNENLDCLDGLCVEGVDGRFCTVNCITECPSDEFVCIPITLGGSDPFNACVPKYPNLCKPCRAHNDCRNSLQPGQTALCVPAASPGDGSFCAAACDTGETCPEGYSCNDVPLTGGGVARQCLPDDGMCDCRPAWAELGLVTDCINSNEFGECAGTRTCGTDGLTACGPKVAMAEICNGGDDNCNGFTDDIEPTACVISNDFGQCPGTSACSPQGADICDGTAPAVEVCNGFDDNCTGGTDEGTCDDGLACTSNICEGLSRNCRNPIVTDACLINGTCYADGDPNPAFPCQRCRPNLSQTAWSGDDGGSCFIDGQCYAAGEANPTNPCLVCNPIVPGGWSLAPANTACNDGDACSANDICMFGMCIGRVYSCDGLGCCVGDGTCTNEAPPGVVEDCSDTVDNDCDGLTDEGALEQCADALDNDCDGLTDESGSTWGERFFARTHRVTTNPVTLAVGIYTSNGDGTFQTPRLVTMPDTRNYAIAAIADFDADGFFDLIVGTTEQDGSNTYHLARESCPSGSATLLRAFSLPSGHAPMAFVDANNDGFIDVLVRVTATNTGYTLLNGGDVNNIGFSTVNLRQDGANWTVGGTGGTTPAIPISTYTCGWAFGIGANSKDVTGDGLVDLIAFCNPNGGSTASDYVLYQGRGDGTFENALIIPRKPLSAVNVVMAGDFDVNGTQDWISGLDDDGNSTGGSDPGAMYYTPNRGGSPALATTWADSYTLFDVTPPTSDKSDYPGLGTASTYDFNRDGRLDIIAAWVPEISACTASVWDCTDGVTGAAGPADFHTRVGLYTNVTNNPCGAGARCNEADPANPVCERCRGFCGERRCGSDGCGGSCGSCAAGEVCDPNGQCVLRNECVPNCTNRTCGDNGCGGVCGTCGDGAGCVNGSCVANCVPRCSLASGLSKTCGSDGCGGTCAVFRAPSANTWISNDDSHYIQVVTPSNAPPTPATVNAFIDTPAGQPRTMQCTATNIYDIESFRVEFRWFRNGAFSPTAGNRQILPASVFRAGESWRCEARAYDGMDYGPWRSSRTLIVP